MNYLWSIYEVSMEYLWSIYEENTGETRVNYGCALLMKRGKYSL